MAEPARVRQRSGRARGSPSRPGAIILTYLLDTDICIDLTRHKRDVSARFLRYRQDQLALNTVVAGELLAGVPRSHDPARTQREIDQLFSHVMLLALHPSVASWYGQVRSTLAAKGAIIGANDLWIAAHALALDLTLVTNNEREFSRVPNLRIENWTKPA